MSLPATRKLKYQGPSHLSSVCAKPKAQLKMTKKKLTRSKGWKKTLTMKIWEEYTLYTPLSFSYSWSGGAGVLVETWRTESANLSAAIIIMTSYLSSSSSSCHCHHHHYVSAQAYVILNACQEYLRSNLTTKLIELITQLVDISCLNLFH